MKILLTTLLFATLALTEVINLKKLEIEHQEQNKFNNNYIKGAEYYFGQGKVQDFEKAKAIYKRNNNDSFLSIYSKELEKLINLKIQPNENSGLDLLKKSLNIYKKTNSNDTWHIQYLNNIIKNWNTSTYFKFSADKRSKVLQYKGDFLFESHADGYLRNSFTEIESPSKKVLFKNFTYNFNYYPEKFIFLDNRKLLIEFSNSRSARTFILDLESFNMKNIGGGFINIERFDSKRIINLIYKSYHQEGGAFWYTQSYDITGKKIKGTILENFLENYTQAHNTRNLDKLNEYYFDTIHYYNSKRYSKRNVIKDKKRFLKKYKNFNMKTEILGIQQESKNDFIISYTKKVIYGEHNKIFDSRLKVRILEEKVYIKEENDIFQ